MLLHRTHLLRKRQREVLATVSAQREGLDRRVTEQEQHIQQRLDTVDSALQVG